MSPKFTSLNAGYEHVCGVMTDSSVVCWGGNRNGQADASVGISFESVSAGSRHSCGVKTDGTAVCWGGWADDRMSSAEAARAGGLFGAGAVPEHLADTEFISLSAGNTFTCGIKADCQWCCCPAKMSAQLVSENVRLGGRHAIGLLCQGRGGCAPHRRAVGQGILFSGLPMDAQFPGDCPKGQAPEFSLLDGFPYGPLTRGGLSVQFRSGFAFPSGPVDISCFQSCQALLPAAVDCHAPLALIASLRTRSSSPEQTRTRRCLLGGDGLPQILHGYQAFQVLVYFHLQSGVV